MRQAERLIALRALLARVQSNAKERRAELAAQGLGPDAPRPDPVSSMPPAPPPPRGRARERVASPRGAGFDDDWSSLLTRDLNDPSPERRARPPEPPPPPALPFSRVASFMPPPMPPELPPASVAHSHASQRIDDDDKHPDSEIVRAIRLAAEHPHPVVDPRDMWTGALRERRPATNPPVPPRPEDLEPDDDGPILDLVRLTPASGRTSSRPPPARSPSSRPPSSRSAAAPGPAPPLPRVEPDEAPLQPSAEREPPPVPLPTPPRLPRTATPAASAALAPLAPLPHEDDLPELPAGLSTPSSYLAARSRGRRIERTVSPRKKTSRRVLAALVIAAPLAGLTAWLLVDEPRRDARDGVPSTSVPTGSVRSQVPISRSAPLTASPPLVPSIPAVPLASSPPSTPPSAPSAAAGPPKVIPPPPAPQNPRESGMLWVDADPPSAIFVQGVAAGDSAKWLEVPCGLKNVRLARPGLPPPGHSFPMWLGVGQTVLIPCGGSHRVALRPD